LEATTLELETNRGRRAPGDIEVGEVNVEAAAAAGSISIVVRLQRNPSSNCIPHSQRCIVWWHYELQVF
jgi:hypothetical protein